MRCLLLEAGKDSTAHTYPRKEIDANAQLFWGGGIELNTDASIGLLRPKVVGGGSIVNQALMDRFDDSAFDAWRAASGVSSLTRAELDPWYDKRAEPDEMRTVPEEYRNGNAEVFRARLRRQRLSLRAAEAGPGRLPLRGRQLLHRMPRRLPHRQQAEHGR